MKKWWIIPVLVLLLTGCGKPESFETIMDQTVLPGKKEKMVIMIDVPDDASLEAMESDENCSVYVCDDYSLTTYTVEGGDLKKTILEATGFLPEQLDIIRTREKDMQKYICVWTAVGESAEQVGRCAVIDDGDYHYVLTAMADAEKAGILAQNEWLSVFRSFRLIAPEDVVNSGS